MCDAIMKQKNMNQMIYYSLDKKEKDDVG